MKRRDALKLIAIGGAATSAGGQVQDPHHALQMRANSPDSSKQAVYEPKYFSQHEYAVISRLADLIIPKDTTPGALDARVPEYLDLQTSEMPAVQVVLSGGIQWLDRYCDANFGTSFLDCSETQQREVLDRLISTEDSSQELAAPRAFFFQLRALTCDGFYSSKFGFSELGYRGNTGGVWRGCTHPEHGA